MKIDRRGVLALGVGAAFMPWSSRSAVAASKAMRLRVSVLKFGSLNWLMDTIFSEGIDKKYGLDLKTVPVATNSAGPIALIAGNSDVIVSDWPWAMRQRSAGELLKFAPYSSALGAVMVAPDSGIKTLSDLRGKRLGVAGSPVDKSWILLRAYSRKTLGKDISELATPVFGAAPLVAEEMKSGRVDAVLNFWTFCARLKGNGFVPIISMDKVFRSLGVEPVPLVGFVWKEKKEVARPETFKAFLDAVAEGNQVLASSDEAWERLRKKMRAKNQGEFVELRDNYRSGIPKAWSQAQTEAASGLLGLLKELGSRDLAGRSTMFDPKLFYRAT